MRLSDFARRRMARHALDEVAIMLVLDGASPRYRADKADAFAGQLEDGRTIKVKVRGGVVVDAFEVK